MKWRLEAASLAQTERICQLINLAYRGKRGWTKETHLVDGDRSNYNEIREYISNPNTHLLVAVEKREIISCICIERDGESAHIGFFAVDPKLQGCGLGKEILQQAECYASINLNAKKFVMTVVSQRTELITYYERRGYIRTGRVEKYPLHLNVGTPLKKGLTVERMEKKA
ncbi:MAG: GNAT family N-acetyltransferase [Gammaproteobacteria bacterium]|nr:GNAT family N-acetyltransferase [Gammaproteobacteria bacterium]MCF6229963.1 GNAT family N-acetyltransferase [Gammaproteobacteria bacterium]